jgi:hypothetical protein
MVKDEAKQETNKKQAATSASTLNMEAVCSIEMSAYLCHTIWHPTAIGWEQR